MKRIIFDFIRWCSFTYSAVLDFISTTIECYSFTVRCITNINVKHVASSQAFIYYNMILCICNPSLENKKSLKSILILHSFSIKNIFYDNGLKAFSFLCDELISMC